MRNQGVVGRVSTRHVGLKPDLRFIVPTLRVGMQPATFRVGICISWLIVSRNHFLMRYDAPDLKCQQARHLSAQASLLSYSRRSAYCLMIDCGICCKTFVVKIQQTARNCPSEPSISLKSARRLKPLWLDLDDSNRQQKF